VLKHADGSAWIPVKFFKNCAAPWPFLARDSVYAIAAIDYRPSVRPFVCPSVCPSVTRADQSNTVKVRTMQPSPQVAP